MRTSTIASVWAYMLLAVAGEVLTFYYVAGATAQIVVISILALSQSVAVGIFYMQLKDEPVSIRLFAIVGVMFLAALFIATVASLG